MIGKIYGSYRILGPLGEGGMGVVYEAEHVQVGRRAAIKVLLPEWSNNEVIVERFFNEARSSVMANHPGIVEIFDCGWSDEGKAYLVMELLEGQPLSELLAAEGPLPVHRMTSMARQTAAALAAAHDKGIVHRDLKPENIFVIPDQYAQGGERIKVLDFGVAKLAIARRDEQTVAGVMLGTPLYMAPEQCLSSAEVDGRGDVYSLGCIMFEMVCGRPPFVDDDPVAVAAMQVKEPPPRPRSLRPDLPPSVESLILRTLAKNREARPQSMTDLRSELDVVWSLMRPDGEPSRELPAISPGVPVIKVAATTMRGAAAEVSRPDASDKGSHEAGQTASKAGACPGRGDLRKRLPVRTALGVAVAAAMALGSFVLMGGGQRPSDRGTGSDRLETTGTPVDARPEPSLIVVHLDSSPPGARVYLAGEQVGITPLKRAFPRSNEAMRFRLEQDGYQPRLIDIACDHDQSTTIPLEPLPR